jgi:hypothetical protein
MADPWYSTEDAADVLGVTPRRVRYLKDRIGYVRKSGALWFRRSAVFAFKKATRPRGRAPGRPLPPEE